MIAHVRYAKISNMTPRLSGHFSVFGSLFFVLKSLLEIARQWIPFLVSGVVSG